MSDQHAPPTVSERFQRLPLFARIAVGIGAVVVAGVVVNAVQQPATSQQPAASGQAGSSPQVAAAPETAAPVVASGIGPGEWLVGSQVEPGTYASTGPAEDGDYCLWSRKDAAGVGPLDNILASDGTYDPGQMLVTIEPTDVVFRTQGCAPFERIK